MKTDFRKGDTPSDDDELKQDIDGILTQLEDGVLLASPEDTAFRIIREYNRKHREIRKTDYPDNLNGYIVALLCARELEYLYAEWLIAFNEKYPAALDKAIFRYSAGMSGMPEQKESGEQTKANIYRLLPCFAEYDPEYAAEYQEGMKKRWEGFDFNFED